MDYVLDLLKVNKRSLERHIRKENLMQTNMQEATKELRKINQLKRAIKIINVKNKKL